VHEGYGFGVMVVVGVLKELENETRIACAEVPWETAERWIWSASDSL